MNKEEERTRIGRRITEIRNSLGWTQEQLAERTGLAQSNIARIEAGRYSSRLDTLALIAEAFGCKVDFIRDGH